MWILLAMGNTNLKTLNDISGGCSVCGCVAFQPASYHNCLSHAVYIFSIDVEQYILHVQCWCREHGIAFFSGNAGGKYFIIYTAFVITDFAARYPLFKVCWRTGNLLH